MAKMQGNHCPQPESSEAQVEKPFVILNSLGEQGLQENPTNKKVV